MTDVFEGSAGADLADDAAVECGVCWWVYDPAQGDESADIEPGTPFNALPGDWRCPSCDNDKSKFMLREPGGTPAETKTSGPLPLEARLGALLEAYQKAERAMIGLPIHNPALDVEAVGFRAFQDGFAGVAITPWSMNIVYLNADPKAPAPGAIGSTRRLGFPSGTYSFILGRMDGVGMVESCSLFSPMDEFGDQDAARDAAEAAVEGLFEVEEPEPPKAVSRRFLFTYKGEPV